VARIALDIDSTLHHYWDLLEGIAQDRYGVALPYAEQRDWGITQLEREQLVACVTETHTDENIEGAVPYEGAVEVVTRWHDEQCHFIHVTSHRTTAAHEATGRWLRSVGLPFDDLYCSDDKITRCAEIGIDVLIDDSPVNLLAAAEAGMRPATLLHPWNRELCEGDDRIVCAADWPGLAEGLAPVLGR